MTAALGSLVVSLGLDAAQYTQGLTKAEFQARKLGESLGTSIRGGALAASGALVALGGAAVAAVAGFNAVLESAAKFQDMAEETGASAESLASLAVAAGTAGVTMESVAGATIKLTKSLVGVDDESKAAGAALAALGLNVAEFKKLDPVAQYTAASAALAQYADGAGKTAVAVALWGKAGAEQLKVMKALEEQGGATVILTEKQIAQADEYLDKQAKLRTELTLYASAIATNFIEPTNVLMGLLRDAAREMLGLSGAIDTVGANNGIRTFAEGVGRALAGVVDNIAQTKKEFQVLMDVVSSFASIYGKVASLDFAGASKTGQDFRDKYGLEYSGFKKDGAAGAKAAESFVQGYDRVLAASKRSSFAQTDPRRIDLGQDGKPVDSRKQLNFNGAASAKKKSGGGGASDDPTKRILENALKAYENMAKQEEDLLRSRNRMLDLYNGENLISTQGYYDGKRNALSESVAKQAALYDKEIEALQSYQAKAGKATDREAAQGKINDLTQKKADLYREAGQAAIEMGFAERQALQGLAQQMAAVNADVLELTGNLSAASKIRLDAQYSDLMGRLTANGDSAGLAQVQRLKDLKGAQAAFGQQTEEVGRITEGLRLQEERIALARQLGSTTELGALQQLGAARQGAVAQMQAMVTAQEAIARASGSPALVTQAEQARLALQQLQATIDPVADSINAKIDDGLSNALYNVATGAMTAEDAVKSMFDTFARELLSFSAKDLAGTFRKALGGDQDGGIGGFFSRAMSSGGGSGGADIGSWFAGLFGRASGGSVQPWQMVRVNENGPEMLDYGGKQYLMNGARNSRVTPLGAGGGGNTSISVNVLPGATRETGYQAARDMARELQRAGRR